MRAVREHLPTQPLAVGQCGRRAPQIHLADHGGRQVGQGRALLGAEGSGLEIQEAQRAERLPVGPDQGSAGVEAEARIAGDEGVVGEARVQAGILDHQRLFGKDRVGAEGDFAACFRDADDGAARPLAGFEPLTVAVHESHQGQGEAEEARGQRSEAVKSGIGRSVQKRIAMQRGQTLFFQALFFQALFF